MSFENASILWGHIVVDELARAGVKHIFITPGSRSTPLVVAAARHPEIIDHSVLDERSAAFAALGVGLATGRPAALICTSGTAVANFSPAVAEADLAGVPMVLVTADRPANLSDAGASQAMEQVGIFGQKVRWTVDLGLPEADAQMLAHARARTARAVFEATAQTGPVHMNVRFRKPLEPTPVDARHRDAVPNSLLETEAAIGRANGAPWATFAPLTSYPVVPTELIELLNQATAPVIVVGAPATAHDREIRAQVEALAVAIGAPVLAETMSGLRRTKASSQVLAGDLLTADEAFIADHPVDLVIQVGRWPVNWPLQAWLRSIEAPIAVVSPVPADPEHSARFAIGGRVRSALEALESSCARAPTPGVDEWTTHASKLRKSFERVSRDAPLDGRVASAVAAWGEPLFVSSSMPLRDVETFVACSERPLRTWANRGLNGIDGVISTAAGVAVGLGERVQVLIGDVAFVHDLTGLVTARRIGAELQVNVVDNDGGRIFDYLPIADHDARLLSKHFTTRPGIDLVSAARGLGLTAERVPLERVSDVRGLADVVVVDNTDSDPTRTREFVDDAIARVRDDSSAPRGVDTSRVDAVLLHGFTGDASTWATLVDQLADLGIRAIAIDLLGHGGRPAHERPTLDAFVDDLLEQLDEMKAGEVHLVGYSMGARVAMAAAVRAPHRFRSLTTIGGHPGLESAARRAERRDHDWALADRLEQGGLPAFLDFWLEQPIFASLAQLGDDWRERSIDQRLRGSARAYAQTLRWAGTGTQRPIWNDLAELELPHLAVAGQLDTKYTALTGELAARTGATTATIEGAGHAAQYERPDEVARELAEFFQRLNDATLEAS